MTEQRNNQTNKRADEWNLYEQKKLYIDAHRETKEQSNKPIDWEESSQG